jgi:hypothetical protein
MGVRYDYIYDFDRFLALTQSPQLSSRPRIEALVGPGTSASRGVTRYFETEQGRTGREGFL